MGGRTRTLYVERSAAVFISLLLAAAAAPAFDQLRFFAGGTRGVGTLKVALRRSVPVTVSGRGRVEPDGSLILN